MCWASSCLRTINITVCSLQCFLVFVSVFLSPTIQPWDENVYPRYLMVLAMVDAALLPKQSFFLRLAAVDSGHVPVWARTAPTLDVTRKPIPNRVLTLNIQMDPDCWQEAKLNKIKTLHGSQEEWNCGKLLLKSFSWRSWSPQLPHGFQNTLARIMLVFFHSLQSLEAICIDHQCAISFGSIIPVEKHDEVFLSVRHADYVQACFKG